MPSFRDYIEQCGNTSKAAIKNAAFQALPDEACREPWKYTKRGGSDSNRAIYSTELELDAYLAAYIDWHIGKLNMAFEMLDESLPQRVNIIDWACGQGLGTLYLMEIAANSNPLCIVDEVVLIEPSEIALGRAEYLIKKTNPNVKVRAVNKMLDDVSPSDIRFENQAPVFQIFSNILDIDGIDLKHLTSILLSNSESPNALICASPNYPSGNIRLERFFEYFRQPIAFEQSASGSTDKFTYNIHIARLLPDDEGQIVAYKFFPPVQFRAAYELSALNGVAVYPRRLTYFDVYAPFDLSASISDDPHPVLAVLNNIVTRGLATFPSPFVERAFCGGRHIVRETSENGVIKFGLTGADSPEKQALESILNDWANLKFGSSVSANELAYTPLAVARLQKLLIEVLLTGRLSLYAKKWRVLVEEADVPCAALAFEDFRQMFDTLTSMSEEYANLKLPKIDLTIVSNDQYYDSPLHRGEYHVAQANNDIKCAEYDLVIHYSTDVRHGGYDFSAYKAKGDCYFALFSANEDNLKAQRYVYTTDRINYQPFVSRNELGRYDENKEQVDRLTYFLNLLFRKEKFRDGQLPILTRALSNKPVIGLLPTGGGKSLTYQLAALLQPGVTIVIDPIVSLMKDQYDGLIRNGIDSCTYINSLVSMADKVVRAQMMERSKLQFVFLSPERLCIMSFRSLLRNMQDMHVYFAYGVIDEVHCVSEWGHDFRFTYLHLGRNLYNYVLPKQTPDGNERITLFGLTATASFDVLADVERELSGNGAFPLDNGTIVRYENTNRLELQYHVVPIDITGCKDRWDAYRKKNSELPEIMRKGAAELRELLRPKNISRIKERFIEREAVADEKIKREIKKADLSVEVGDNWYSEDHSAASAIVFCPHRKGSIGVNDTDNNVGVASTIASQLAGSHVSGYVGGDKLDEQQKFLAGDTSIMVATKAFGMGIDKPNVRLTYNVCYSSSLEAFVQEAGRAGRDRRMALATILYCQSPVYGSETDAHVGATASVDYDVHKFFYDNNFIGERFEKRIMHYLLTEAVAYIDDGASSASSLKPSSGFMDKLLLAKEGDSIEVDIPYSEHESQESVEKLNMVLHSENLKLLSFPSYYDQNVNFVDAVEKAIYRMCCVGIIDDYTRDYNNEQFRIVAKRRSEDDYFNHLKTFLMRYYVEERAEVEVEKAKECKGDNAIQKCLGYITGFVYNNIAKKRERAIRDIETFCNQAVNSSKDWLETNEDLKDFIYFYFNSKFARDDYMTEAGVPYSLTSDTEHGKKSSYEILFKYMNVGDDDVVGGSGSPKDNIKHLQGAVRLIRRSLTDSNPALDFLNVFCLLYLYDKESENTRNELRNSYIDGYNEFRSRSKDLNEFYDNMELFSKKLVEKNAATPDQLAELDEWQQQVEAEIQLEWLSNFKEQYTQA